MFIESIPYLDKVLLTKHLSVMIKSGIPILEAVTILEDQSTNIYLKKILKSIATDVANGKFLYLALSKYKKDFDPLYISLIKIGEQSGNLETNLKFLADQMKKNYEFNQKVRGALMYPTLVLATAIAVGAGLTFFVLPNLVDLFKSLDVPLPLSTQILLGVASVSQRFGVFILAGLIGMIIVFRFAITLPKIKPLWHAFILRLPILGGFYQSVELSFFCRNLGMMLGSGLSIVTTLDTLQIATNNEVFRLSITKIRQSVEKGNTVENSIQKLRLPFFPKLVTRMIGVGERSGSLDESLVYLGEFFEEDVDNRSKNFSVVLEPIMLLLVGLAVAFVAIAIISPIYQFTGSIKR